MIALLGIVTVGATAFFGFRFLTEQIDEFAGPFEEKGYNRVSGQIVVEEDTIEDSRVYTVQVLKLENGASADLAIVAQVAEIRGTIEGDIDFMGQVLDIKKGAVVKGDIRSKAAQVIKVRGSVEGKITGTYQALDQRDAAPAAEVAPSTETVEDAAETLEQNEGDSTESSVEES